MRVPCRGICSACEPGGSRESSDWDSSTCSTWLSLRCPPSCRTSPSYPSSPPFPSPPWRVWKWHRTSITGSKILSLCLKWNCVDKGELSLFISSSKLLQVALQTSSRGVQCAVQVLLGESVKNILLFIIDLIHHFSFLFLMTIKTLNKTFSISHIDAALDIAVGFSLRQLFSSFDILLVLMNRLVLFRTQQKEDRSLVFPYPIMVST